jgi:DNA repair protein RadA/Sms
MLRGQKNRFGPTSEVAVFEMSSVGLIEVANPSERFLAERSKDMAGSSVVAHLEGSRAFLTEFQALVNRCPFGYPRRTVQGLDQNRVSVLMAVAEKQLEISFADKDVFCKVASGNRIEEPAADLPILMALVSAAYGKALPSNVGFLGEVGLGGELRSVPAVNARLSELALVGIKKAFVPQWNLKEAKEVRGISVESAQSVSEIADKIFR